MSREDRPRRRRLALLGVGLLLAAVLVPLGLVALTRGPPPPSPVPPGAFSFAALGDSPYYFFEDMQYRVVLQDLAAHDLAAVVHVGDLFWEPCTEARYRRSLGEFDALPHPVVYTPGDNEWTDCWQHGDGSYALDRLRAIRRIFFAEPERSLGGRRIDLATQGGREPYAEFVENARWVHEGVVFATVHLVGSWNGTMPRPDRTAADDEEPVRRTGAAAAWTAETFDVARVLDASAVVLAFHGNPGLEEPADSAHRAVFEPFRGTLAREAERFGRPVLVVHGDWHEYIVDRPLETPSGIGTLENVVRVQVPGSYDVGWVRVTVAPGEADPFSFEPRVVPRWKYW